MCSWSFQKKKRKSAQTNKIQLLAVKELQHIYNCTPVCRKRDDCTWGSLVIHLYQRSYSSSLKIPLSFCNFKILLITHLFSVIICNRNSVQSLSQTPPTSPPLSFITDLVWGRNFHLPPCILMLIVKNVMRSSRQFHFVKAHRAISISLEC